MGFWSASCHLSYKFKLLMLITLCALLIGWATSTYLVDILHETPAKGMIESFRKPTTIKEKQMKNSKTKAMLIKKLPTVIPLCPSLSPYLRGPSKLIFRASLTLEEVQKENPSVAKGRHRPKDCTARQRVAILIPHRNREKHLLYLLENLHPFLQRQQLDYGLYVIHQTNLRLFSGSLPPRMCSTYLYYRFTAELHSSAQKHFDDVGISGRSLPPVLLLVLKNRCESGATHHCLPPSTN